MTAQLICVKGSHVGKKIPLALGETPRVRIGDTDDSPLMEFSYEGECWHVTCDVEMEVNGHRVQACILQSGDEVYCADCEFKFEADDIVSIDFMAETHDDSEEFDDEIDMDGNRRRRRIISASHQAVLTTPENEKKGLLGRVGKAFRRRDDRLERLEELEQKRSQLLAMAGRFCLEHQGGLGLPHEFLVQIFKGKTIELNYEQLSKSHIDHFRMLRDRLLFIDADIDAFRIEMGLAAENRKPLEELHLRADHEAQEEHAFQAMDAVATVDNEFDVNSASEQFDFGSEDESPPPGPQEPSDDRTDIIRREPAADASDEGDGKDSQQSQASARRRSATNVRRRRRTR